MKKYNILVLTDHKTHSENNSVYELCEAMRLHQAVGRVHMASRGNEANKAFFYEYRSTELEVWSPRKKATYEEARTSLIQRTIRTDIRFYDAVWLRLPRPIPEGFFSFLTQHVDECRLINRPSGILETSHKAFLLNVPELCPPIELCQTTECAWNLQEQYPIVLKPVEDYGGRGVVRLENGHVYDATQKWPFKEYLPVLEAQMERGGYLAMKYLSNVDQGDKRVVVVNGQILGAVLRMPPEGSWICNASQGGRAVSAELEKEEYRMVERLNEWLLPRGIAMYGIDTLVDDEGKRILSEVNTLSIGGIKPMAELSGLPLVEKAADLLMDYIQQNVVRRLEHGALTR